MCRVRLSGSRQAWKRRSTTYRSLSLALASPSGTRALRCSSVRLRCSPRRTLAVDSQSLVGSHEPVAKAIERGTQFVGISDFTAFQLAVLAKTSAVTWAGPALCEGFGVGGAPDLQPDDIMEDCFHDMVSEQGEGTGWRQNQAWSGVAPLGIRNATVWGGNLSVLVSMVATPYFPSIKGGILFLEDVGEHPYQIERMLTQLLHAGILADQKAIVLGQFTGYKLSPHDKGFKFNTVVAWLQAQLKVPVLTNLPYGHVQTKVLLPVGKKADLLAEGKDVMLVWGH